MKKLRRSQQPNAPAPECPNRASEEDCFGEEVVVGMEGVSDGGVEREAGKEEKIEAQEVIQSAFYLSVPPPLSTLSFFDLFSIRSLSLLILSASVYERNGR